MPGTTARRWGASKVEQTSSANFNEDGLGSKTSSRQVRMTCAAAGTSAGSGGCSATSGRPRIPGAKSELEGIKVTDAASGSTSVAKANKQPSRKAVNEKSFNKACWMSSSRARVVVRGAAFGFNGPGTPSQSSKPWLPKRHTFSKNGLVRIRWGRKRIREDRLGCSKAFQPYHMAHSRAPPPSRSTQVSTRSRLACNLQLAAHQAKLLPLARLRWNVALRCSPSASDSSTAPYSYESNSADK